MCASKQNAISTLESNIGNLIDSMSSTLVSIEYEIQHSIFTLEESDNLIALSHRLTALARHSKRAFYQ